MRKKKNEEKEFEKQLAEVEFTDEDPTIELLKELIKVNKEIKELLTKLKDRFV